MDNIIVKYNKTKNLVIVYDDCYKIKSKHKGRKNKKGVIANYNLKNQTFKFYKNHIGNVVDKQQKYIDLINEFLGYDIDLKQKSTPLYKTKWNSYKEYLLSSEWQEKRIKKIKEVGNRCEICNSKETIHIHHRTYIRIFKEKQSDLTALCKKCHKLFHDSIKKLNQQYWNY